MHGREDETATLLTRRPLDSELRVLGYAHVISTVRRFILNWRMGTNEASSPTYVVGRNQNARVSQKNFSLAQATFLLNVERESIRSAFFVISRSYQERSDFVIEAPVNPAVDPLRDDPRFKDLLKRMNLPE